MELEYIQKKLILVGNNLSQKITEMDCYLFGSILKKPIDSNDIDVLIIYTAENQIQTIKNEFENLAMKFPVHMNYFTYDEEKELNFIKQQGANKIFGL